MAEGVKDMEEIPALALGLALGFIIYRLRILDLWGSLVAVALGTIIGISAGMGWLSLLVLFLVLGFLSTKYGYAYKESLGVAEKGKGRRGVDNVLANGLVPAFIAVLWFMNSENSLGTMLKAGYIAAVATVTGDTLSSEIGMLSRGRPYLITTFKKVPVGTHGGVSLMGELGGFGGALVIGLGSYLLGLADLRLCLLSALIGGAAGFHVDSFLGAILERRQLVGNATVNFISSLTGSLIGLRIAVSL
jgi:uncharacterized protein (TIGR00297 family)